MVIWDSWDHCASTPDFTKMWNGKQNRKWTGMESNGTICNKICIFTPLEHWQHRCTQRRVKGRLTCHHLVLLSTIACEWSGIKTIPQCPRFHRDPLLWNFWIRHWYYIFTILIKCKGNKNRYRVWVSDHSSFVISRFIIAIENYVYVIYIHILYQFISISHWEKWLKVSIIY